MGLRCERRNFTTKVSLRWVGTKGIRCNPCLRWWKFDPINSTIHLSITRKVLSVHYKRKQAKGTKTEMEESMGHFYTEKLEANAVLFGPIVVVLSTACKLQE